VEIYTIGFTQKSASQFFGTLRQRGIRRLIDVRLSNQSQLAGFTKRDDLEYFLRELCGAEYVHEPRLAPTKEILDAYKAKDMPWAEYERQFLALLAERGVECSLDCRLFDVPAVLLCSEPTAERCHRRLVAEYLAAKWGDVTTIHLD
jgi:uncharacterized protein (DUF488 family)